MPITPEQAMKAARDAATPVIERITKLIDNQLSKYVGVGQIMVEVPTKMKGKGTAKPVDVHQFMVSDVVKTYEKPTETGSRWEVDFTLNSSRKSEEGEGDGVYELFFTPIFPSTPPNNG